MFRRISLANKCLLLFGAAVVLIILAALSVPWVRMNQLIDEGELASCRQIAATWQASERRPSTPAGAIPAPPARIGLSPGERLTVEDSSIQIVGAEQIAGIREQRSFLLTAWDRFAREPQTREISSVRWHLLTREYHYAKVIRGAAGPSPDGRVEMMIVVERESANAGRTVLINTGFLISAGCVALGLAVLVFYLITNRIILSPVRRLRETAEIVRSGALDQRSDIHTGDEFEELAESFNEMLQNVQTKQEELRRLNAAMDDKLTELEQRNQSLYEATRLKGDFLANVTHELRTPLNSILGFAELLDEQVQRDAEAGEDTTRISRRKRYIDNILSAGRALLDLINGLLEMAKVEAGKMELNIAPMNLKESCETMIAMMKPLADKRLVDLRFEQAPGSAGIEEMPPVITDSRKFQQILYNLLSNAIKFTADAADAREAQMAAMDPEAAEKLSRMAHVTLRAERLIPRAGEGAGGADSHERIRISVLDTGPGIKPEDQPRIFEKFTQLDSGHQRKHAGTGLGLSIVKELTQLLQGEVQVESELGRGSMFSVILPISLNRDRTAETKLELALRGALAGQKN